MIIQLGKIVINKTKKYLTPCLKNYGTEFEQLYNSIFKVGLGIGDLVLIRSNISYEQHVFILIDIDRSKHHFIKFLDYVKNEAMYEDDYAYDDIQHGNLHMVVIKLPESCYKATYQFKKSQFSKMFTSDEVKRYFKEHSDEKAVIVKDNNYRIKFATMLNSMYETNMNPDEFDGELDFTIKQHEEYFDNQAKNIKT